MLVPLVRPSLLNVKSNANPDGEDAEPEVVAVEIVGENGTLPQPVNGASGSVAWRLWNAPGAAHKSTSKLDASEEVHEVGSVTNAGGSRSSKWTHPASS